MNTRFLIAALLLTAVTSPAISQSNDHAGCGNNVTVYVDKMGIVNEKMLRQHIEAAQTELERIRGMSTQSRERRMRLREHLDKMQRAMQDMHDLKLTGDCAAAAHGASLETRVGVLEKRLDMIQDMLEQVIANQKESAKD
jgi:phage shock protein A